MSEPVYRWIIVYKDGHTEEKEAKYVCEFADDFTEEPIAIIRGSYV